jgi:hypothetical protein
MGLKSGRREDFEQFCAQDELVRKLLAAQRARAGEEGQLQRPKP